ncbi:hypothetical protein D3C81_1542030 [compost metagenome]
MHQDILFEFFDPCFNPVADREVIVYDCIDQMVKEPVRLADLLLPQNRLQDTQLMNLLLGDGNDEMSAQKNVKRPEENLLIIKTDAVDYNKIMALINFNLRPLFLFAEAILNGQIMQIVQRLKQLQILVIGIDPVEPF